MPSFGQGRMTGRLDVGFRGRASAPVDLFSRGNKIEGSSEPVWAPRDVQAATPWQTAARLLGRRLHDGA
jgi:hypothetical protein